MKLWGGEANRYGQRWSLLHTFLIPNPAGDRTYLKRLRIIQTPYFGVYLHHIYLADADRDPHDHPWNFWSFIVRGGYTEDVFTDRTHSRTAERRRFSLHRHPTRIAHIIRDLEPGTVTLVLVGRRRREWGFWTPEGFVEWKAYERNGLGTVEAIQKLDGAS